ncbi:unnamed protein product [Cylindrotheca closterium]|uniref:Uncharacterized protein n=1 Tax=Cylindrotheca closterium TaxID=2856 RepID=A0AAD2FTH4_9STRA|nr:unnamed protein product [Cylindrotheca closterium]
MDNDDTNSKVPLLEDIETPLEVSAESVYPVKNKNKECRWKNWKNCKHGKCKKARCVKKCLKVICKVALVGFLLFGAVASIAGYRWYRFVSHQVQQWTVTEPNALPVQDVPLEELALLEDSARFFWDSIQYGKVPEDFVLTAKDLNGFFASEERLRGNAFAEMKANEYQVSLSIPTDGLPGGKGRYFVATKTLNWDPENQELKVKIQPMDESMGTMAEAVLKLTTMEDGKTLNLQVLSGQGLGHIIPQKFIDEQYNLLEDLYNCDCHDHECKQARKFLEGLAGVAMEDGQVVVHADPEPKEATYYKEHEGHSWHHGHHGHRHHGKHGKHGHRHGDHHHGGDHGHHHGGRRHLRAKIGGHRHLKALHMLRKLMA